MNNDLISRKYVKAEVAKRYDLLLQNNGGSFRELCDIYWYVIDNAPAVEIATKLQPNCNNLQPKQGEWIDHSEEGYVECPFCEHLTNCEDNIDELHYCWNCGAYMRKGGAV